MPVSCYIVVTKEQAWLVHSLLPDLYLWSVLYWLHHILNSIYQNFLGIPRVAVFSQFIACS